ncbi:MAG TPA: DUF2314 domain-containing protein [Polyangiaceae bacterium]|nr:DUF2314 domain-containing protein [Polyangiaceae bacterium]
MRRSLGVVGGAILAIALASVVKARFYPSTWKKSVIGLRGPSEEPKFRMVARSDPEMATAHRQATATIQHFAAYIARPGDRVCAAKLRFRDPDFSDELGEDQFVFLWLTSVTYDQEEQRFSGLFFEVPRELTKWHKVGERLAFDAEEIFDWMIVDQGALHGGFTLRVTRQRLPETKRADYDRRVGAISWHPLPQ